MVSQRYIASCRYIYIYKINMGLSNHIYQHETTSIYITEGVTYLQIKGIQQKHEEILQNARIFDYTSMGLQFPHTFEGNRGICEGIQGREGCSWQKWNHG